MKTIGLIGGMSWESSVLYYQVLNRRVRELLGGNHSCECLMLSVDFAEIATLQHNGDWKTLAARMISAARQLESGGADFVLLCTNTMHKVADDIQRSINIPLIHIVDTTAAEINRHGMKKLGLLATRFSMEEDFLKGRYKDKFGIETIIPDETERAEIHRIIYDELVKGTVHESSRLRFLEVAANLISRGAEGIILGCTEIELLIKPSDLSVTLFETARIHAEAAVELALNE